MLQIDCVSRRFESRSAHVDALCDVSLRIDAGRLELIKGHSGSGKTTLLLIAGGMSRPSSGRVWIDGQDVYRLGQAQRTRLRAKTIGFLFQSANLIPYLSAVENVLLAAPDADAAARNRAVELLDGFGLADRIAHRPDQLSQGERQRVALARAALNRPAVLLADEPTGNLDPQSAEVVFRALREMADDGAAVLTATHADTPLDLADRVHMLTRGRMVSEAAEAPVS